MRLKGTNSLKTNFRHPQETDLEIAFGTFSQTDMMKFVDDCIVPALVERFLRQNTNLPAFGASRHNVDQL